MKHHLLKRFGQSVDRRSQDFHRAAPVGVGVVTRDRNSNSRPFRGTG